jgi:dihydroneopterin triphosphate diphosphatase
MRQPVSALVHPVTREGTEWRFLLMRRVAMPQYGLPIFWQGVSGGVEDDETPDQAAARELFEETGIDGVPLHRVGFTRTLPMQPEWTAQYARGTTEIIEHAFVCILPELVEPKLSWEHSEFAWLPYPEAYDRLRYQGNKESLHAVKTWLAGPECES